MDLTLYLAFKDLLRFESSYRSRSKEVVVVGPEETKHCLVWQLPQERPL